MNALSGITVLGALAVTAVELQAYSKVASAVIGIIAIVLAIINVTGGFGVTARMLKMFKKEDK
jgi:NAD(P) transhydrogenase subunit alpha